MSDRYSKCMYRDLTLGGFVKTSILHRNELLADSNNGSNIQAFKWSTSLTSHHSLDSGGRDEQIMVIWKCCNMDNSRSLFIFCKVFAPTIEYFTR